MSRVLALALAALVLAAPAACRAADAVPGQLIVGFKSGVANGEADDVLAKAGGRFRTRFRGIKGGAVRARSGVGLSVLRRRLARHRSVAYVEPDFLLKASRVPNDPLFPQQYGQTKVSAPAAWDRRVNCSKVAVLDTGTQPDHPDLKGNVWHNSGEKQSNGKDDDKNGYVDDYYGVNLVKGRGSGVDDNGHGTHVSGIVGARGDNGVGVAGVCWQTSIMPVKFMDSSGKGATSDAVSGIDYAVHEGAKVVNCSFGSTSSSKALGEEIDHAKDKGVLLVVAAGNDGRNIDNRPEYPAADTSGNVFTVAATGQLDTLASFSNFGASAVDVGAPGVGILSTYKGSTYKQLDGTSMAAPFVAGAAAMLRAQRSSASYGQLKSAIRDNGDPVPGLAGVTKSGRRLNLDRALQAIGP